MRSSGKNVYINSMDEKGRENAYPGMRLKSGKSHQLQGLRIYAKAGQIQVIKDAYSGVSTAESKDVEERIQDEERGLQL